MEQRRHAAVASLGLLYARSKSQEASGRLEDYLPSFARPGLDERDALLQDVSIGSRLGVLDADFAQALVDELMN